MKIKFFFLFGFLLVLISFSFWQYPLLRSLFLALRGERQILSPLAPKSGQILGEITTLETDFDFGQPESEEKILAQGAYVYDLTRNKLIFEKDSHRQLQAASTIKIVTAAVALDKGELNEEMTVNYYPTVVGESSMNLAFGEKFSLEELLYGLLLASGNDAAETIAQGIGGKRETFVGWMNEWAKKVGAKNTNFTTPSGLDEEGQYTTAYDLFLFGREVFTRYPKILEISAIREKYLPKTANHRAYLIRNKFLLWDDFPILAGKPGLGEQGMLSLVAMLQKDNRKILVTLIRTPSLRHDLEQILKLF
ncbi:MAG: D-alanyl-D-alanine carboxypeptidase family protein [Microgenomates group bacterium]